MESSKKVGVTEVVLRDGIQSLLATRVPLRDLVSILPALDRVGLLVSRNMGRCNL